MKKKKRTIVKPAPRPTHHELNAIQAERDAMRVRAERAERLLAAGQMESADRVATGLWAKYFIEVGRAANLHFSADVLMYTEGGRAALIDQCKKLVLLARRGYELESRLRDRP